MENKKTKFKKGDPVKVSKMDGVIDEIIFYKDGNVGYIVKSLDHLFLEEYIVEEKAIQLNIEIVNKKNIVKD